MEPVNEKLYVLDYNQCAIHCIHLTEETDELETEDILNHYGFNIDECSCMFSSDELEINHIY